MMRMTTARFLLLDGIGATLWASLYLGLGFVFRRELERIAAIIAHTGVSMAAAIVCSLAGYIGWKWLDRRRYLRQLAMARLAPEELYRRMQAGEKLTIIDLRHVPEDGDGGPILPGARRFPADELELRHQEIPRDREIVLYCS
jgi:rhodanese-related sulfurtransferase